MWYLWLKKHWHLANIGNIDDQQPNRWWLSIGSLDWRSLASIEKLGKQIFIKQLENVMIINDNHPLMYILLGWFYEY